VNPPFTTNPELTGGALPAPLPRLAEIVGENPASPLFARLADNILSEGNAARAWEICERGLGAHPEHPSGLLVGARALEALGDRLRAAALLARLDQLVPGNAIVMPLVTAWRPAPVSASVPAAKPAKAGPPTEATSSVVNEAIHPALAFEGKIVSRTLAEIYASQGAIAEAIETYRLLAIQRPQEREAIEARVKELREKAAAAPAQAGGGRSRQNAPANQIKPIRPIDPGHAGTPGRAAGGSEASGGAEPTGGAEKTGGAEPTGESKGQ
jgi:tetratricopeptide (TPR) repeat protein